MLLDGLYPNGPVFEECRKKNWDFTIVLKDKSLKSVWDEYDGLKKLCPENRRSMKGFHFLMNIAAAMNELARNSEPLCKEFIEKGFRGFIGFVRKTLNGPWLDKEETEARLRKKYQLSLT